jgi:hypothetical protein
MTTTSVRRYTIDALLHYRQCIIIWEDSHADALAKTARYFGAADANEAAEIYNSNPSLHQFSDDE